MKTLVIVKDVTLERAVHYSTLQADQVFGCPILEDLFSVY
jgi:hypothetical protein